MPESTGTTLGERPARLKGRRVPDGRWFDHPRSAGDYGLMEVEGQGVRWFNRPPNAEPGDPDHVLNEDHVVVIEVDGTITVNASILNRVIASEAVGPIGPISSRGPRPWHGWLEHGVWRST